MKFIISFIAPLALFTSAIATEQNNKTERTVTKNPTLISKPSKLQDHNWEDLKYFVIGEIKFEELNFKSSVELLIKRYHKICEETSEKPLPINVKFQEVPPIGDRKVSITLGGNFDQILSQLAAIHDIRLKKENNSYICSSIIDESQPTNIEAHLPNSVVTLPIPPDFLTDQESENNKLSIRKLKRLANVNNVTIKWLKSKNRMIVTGTQKETAHFKRIVKSMIHRTPIQCKILTKTISYNPNTIELSPEMEEGIKNNILSEGQVQLIMRKLSQQKDTETATFPSIVTRTNEQATISIIRESEKPTSFVGLKFNLKPTINGLSIGLVSDFKYHSIAGMKFAKLHNLPQIIDSDKIDKYHVNFDLLARNNFSHILKLDFPNSDQEHYILISPYLADATGAKIRK